MPRHDAVYETDPPRVRFVRRLPIAADQLWRLAAMPDGMRAWFPSPDVSYEPRVGGPITLGGDPYDPEGSTGTVREYDKGRRLAFDWGDDRLVLTVGSDDLALGRLELLDVLDAEGSAARNAAGWDFCLDALEAAAMGGAPPQAGDLQTFVPHVEAYKAKGFPDDGVLPDEPEQPAR